MPMTAYVLLTQRSADLDAVWGGDAPGDVSVSDVTAAELRFGESVRVRARLGEPISNADLATAGSISPLHKRVMPVVAGHVAALELQADEAAPPHQQMRALCEAIVSLPPLPDAVVWVPYRHQATTLVMFVGELVGAPQRAYYWIHPSWTSAERTEAVATARGLSAVGGSDLQVVGAADDLSDFAEAFDSFLLDAVAVGRLPLDGDAAEIGGTIYAASPGTDVLTEEPLLQLTEEPPAQGSETDRVVRRHWLAPHSSQHQEFHGPYAQIAAAFEDLQFRGIVARMDFACCQSCGHTEIVDERTVLDEGTDYPYREHGYVFFHQQDSDGLAEGSDTLYLAYGAFPGGELLSPWPDSEPVTDEEKRAVTELFERGEVAVGQIIAETVRAQGLQVDWDGDVGARIAVVADWSTAPFPWLREEEDDEYVGDVGLPPQDPTVSDNAWYLLLDSQPNTLGDLLEDFLPNFAAQLQEEDAIAGEIPNEETQVTLWLSLVDRIEDPALAEHAARSEDPEAAAERIGRHFGALCVVGGGRAPALDQVQTQAGVSGEIALRPEVIGLWVPNQERFELHGERIIEDGQAELIYASVHRARVETGEGDGHVLYTRGMRRLGIPELVVEHPERVEFIDMRDTLQIVAVRLAEGGQVPQAGEKVRTLPLRPNAVLHEAEDPITGEPALSLELLRRKWHFGVY